MGWKPTLTEGADDDRPPTPPRRRRRARVVESETPLVDEMAARNPKATARRVPTAGYSKTTKHSIEEENTSAQIRVRLGHRWSQIVTEVKSGEYTWQQFAEGLSEEELARGQLKDYKGGFMGRPPAFVPREFLLACQREQKRRFEEIFGSEVLGIAKSYVELCKDANIPGKDRAKMMQYAMERIFGGIPKDIRIAQEQPWEQVFVNVTNDGAGEMPGHLRERYERYKERDADPQTDE